MKKQKLKFESLNSSRFEAMSNDAMSFIVGGGDCTTGGGTSFGGGSYSNDWVDCDGRPKIHVGGGDFSAGDLANLKKSTC